MDQPTAEDALKRLEPGAHLVQRSTVELPEAPDNMSIMGCDAATAPTTSSTPTSAGCAASTR